LYKSCSKGYLIVFRKVSTIEGKIQVKLEKLVFKLIAFTRIVVRGSNLYTIESSVVVAASRATRSSTGC
jgi:hypothetical protein